ncbi:DMT family transporter [Shimia haliotis]|uniref:Permease of the drug/metabolite transporter (DMT) superfamily n=1 Tax=Shimia haliotis TaxID=1280847 RepID=A0A1I4BBI7_9RHOB|nr:DMT family transporter [Shimia haliotis]SFK65487.1 Permease of the drug/metabolite transporter (DMT) superfamily [Shimia haliotis]
MQNVKGILLIVAAMLGFSLEDMFIKSLSATLPTGQILMSLGLGSVGIFVLLARLQGHRIFTAAGWSPMMILRASCEAVGAMMFATALARVDISTVAAVFQTLPLVITMGAALFLGEQVGWRRWSAIATGFAGVLLIIRPGLDAFDPNTLLVLGSVFAIALRDLLTRRIDVAVSSYVVSLQGFLSLIPAGALMVAMGSTGYQSLQTPELSMLAGAILFGTTAYLGIVTAMRIGEASVVAPFRYSRLVFSMALGMLVFGEKPDLPTLAGAALIIASGLYTFVREQRLARAATAGN